MAGPQTDVEIMSNAAVILGQTPFATIAEADKFAEGLQQIYDMMVPSLLTEAHWKFARKYQQLSLSVDEVDFAEWSNAYNLPSDLISVYRLYPNVNYEVVGNQIYTGTSGELKLEYIYQAPVSRWSEPFKEYFVYALAAKLALSVAEDRNMAQYLEQISAQKKSAAMWVDAQSSPNKGVQSKPWINVRRVASNNFDYFNEGF